MTPHAVPPAAAPRPARPVTARGIIILYLQLLPIAAVLAFCLGRSTVIPDEAGLAHAAFGWPFPWFTQDLSRYASIAYPTRMDVVGSRGNASGPIDTTYDPLLFAANTLVLGVLVLGAVTLLTVIIRAVRARRSRTAA